MISARAVALALFASGLGLGTLADRAPPTPPGRDAQGRLQLQADFHVHSFFGDGAIAPWNLGREARRRGLHALAVTNHNQVFAGRLVRWLNRRWGGPLVLVGQEVTNPGHHIIAAGIERAVDWDAPAATIIADIHAQGGVAIAAHPERPFWPSFDPPALATLDGAERHHPLVLKRPDGQAQLDAFFERARAHRRRPLAAIGSSDFHTAAMMGRCRTLVSVTEPSEAAVLQAIRDGHTTSRCIPPGSGDLPAPAREPAIALGGVLGWLGLLGLILLPGRRRPAR